MEFVKDGTGEGGGCTHNVLFGIERDGNKIRASQVAEASPSPVPPSTLCPEMKFFLPCTAPLVFIWLSLASGHALLAAGRKLVRFKLN